MIILAKCKRKHPRARVPAAQRTWCPRVAGGGRREEPRGDGEGGGVSAEHKFIRN